MSKKLVNAPTSCVSDCLHGLVAVNTRLQLLAGHNVVIRGDVDQVRQDRVTLLSGGGSGHEPAHAGFVGSGMLSGAVAGDVFASPPSSTILAAIRRIASKRGTLVIVKNYTGDRLNFGMAVEKAKAEGIKADCLIVGEDCALSGGDHQSKAGSRGLAGTVFIHKIAGHLAEQKHSLEEILVVCRRACGDMATIGMSLYPCSIPGKEPNFTLASDEMELGLGIHGEAGAKRIKVLQAKEAVHMMLVHMNGSGLNIGSGDRVALMINNLGGTSVLELNVVAKEAIEWLESTGVKVCRAYCGSFMTSLEMAGVSLTVMKVDDTILQCLDSDTQAPGWQKPYTCQADRVTPTPMNALPTGSHKTSTEVVTATVDELTGRMIYKAISYGCEAVGNCERQLNILDTQSGDGDCGTTHKRGTDAIRRALGAETNPTLPISNPYALFLHLSDIVESEMGGSSGALYGIFLGAAAASLTTSCDAAAWCSALEAGIKAVMKYGGAQPGDRTMVDALDAAHQALQAHLTSGGAPLDGLHLAAQEAERAAQRTAGMVARAGRASYVPQHLLTQPDPGAHAVGIGMRAIYEACKLVASSM